MILGSGYVLFSVLRADLVGGLHWLTEAQLLDAITLGQVTPGPVFTSATFIGYLVAGGAGAVVATVGIFLPAFVFTALGASVLHRVRRSARASAFMAGVNAAAVALIGVVALTLTRAALVDGVTVALALGTALVLTATRVNSSWLLAAAALLGWATHLN